MTEQWKPIPGWEGLYEVSTLGQVRGVDRIDASGRRWIGKMRRPKPHGRGYKQVVLWRGGRPSGFGIHRLVLEAFVGPAPEGMQGCHNDGNPGNNSLANLRWDTPSANQLDSVAHGTHSHARKTHCKHGHAYNASNTYMTPGRGDRQCRACKAAREAKRSPRSRSAAPGQPTNTKEN